MLRPPHLPQPLPSLSDQYILHFRRWPLNVTSLDYLQILEGLCFTYGTVLTASEAVLLKLPDIHPDSLKLSLAWSDASNPPQVNQTAAWNFRTDAAIRDAHRRQICPA